MTEMKLLLVEDNEQDRSSCRGALNDLMEDNGYRIELEECDNIDNALSKLNETHYDGAIIDMQLSGEMDGGNQVIEKIKDNFKRIPVAIMTGTPDPVTLENFPSIGVFIKGHDDYKKIIEEFLAIYRTGITRIMGGVGEIEQRLSQIFINNLLETRKKWIEYGKEDSMKTEKALLRHALNHLIHILDDDVGKCYPEEMYIYPPVSKRINTGCVVKQKNSNNYYVVLNPACDLAERNNGGCNTDQALLARIDVESDIIAHALTKKKIKDPDATELTSKEQKNTIDAARKPTTYYYHWLPETNFFPGGYINFRKISTHTKDDFEEIFENPYVQISSPFLKDIVSRFSSYYARQGQPEIDTGN